MKTVGLFDSIKNDVKIGNSRNNDKAGSYWQRIDKIELLTSRKGSEYVKVSKTTLKVLDGENKIGEETSEAFFRDEYNFLEKDLKSMAQVIYGMTTDEVNALTGSDLKELLVDSTDPTGEVIEVSVTEILKKGGTDTFARVKWLHRVTPKALDAGLSDEVKAQYFPAGVMA